MAGKHSSVSGSAPEAPPRFADAQGGSLTNHLLIAMPQLLDPNFAQTVAIICEHTDKGALGIVLNKPLPMKLSDVLSQMKLEPTTADIAAQPVLRGGPVHTDRGFVLHRPGGQWDHTRHAHGAARALPRCVAAQGRAHRHSQLSGGGAHHRGNLEPNGRGGHCG